MSADTAYMMANMSTDQLAELEASALRDLQSADMDWPARIETRELAVAAADELTNRTARGAVMKLKYDRVKFRKATYPPRTYYAKNGERVFTVDYAGTRWTLRSWFAVLLDTYERGDTAEELMKLADEIASR